MNAIKSRADTASPSNAWVSDFRLRNISQSDSIPSKLSVASLPLPENEDGETMKNCHVDGAITQKVDLAWYPGDEKRPRRQLWYSLHTAPIANEVGLNQKPDERTIETQKTSVSLVTTSHDFSSPLPSLHHALELQFGAQAVQIFPGLRWKGALHPWQWAFCECLWKGPIAAAYHAGGVIEVVPTSIEQAFPSARKTNAAIRKSEWLHRQNWLRGELYIICFANGVFEITARHVNNHLFDEGRDQHDIQTGVYFRSDNLPSLDQKWTGLENRFDFGDWKLDLTNAAGMVSDRHPGRLKTDSGLFEWQPYSGVEIGGDKFRFRNNDELFVTGEERMWPRGVGRSVRFGMSLGSEPASLTRLIGPTWWYGQCGEGWPGGTLPATDSSEDYIEGSFKNTIDAKGKRCENRFDDSIIGWEREGETSFAEFLHAYRNQSADSFNIAMRDSYHLADIAYDHATETVRMHNYPLDGTFSLPMFRNLGILFGYLETGDPYLKNIARTIAERFYQLHISNWPRYSIGRDAIAVRGLIALWKYLGDDHYRAKAREILHHVCLLQRPDGSFSDQGGGVGIHAAGYLCSKPWMANLANEAVVDYLEVVGSDTELEEELVRFGSYLLQHGPDVAGDACWPYQTHYAGGQFDPVREFFKSGNGRLPDTEPQVRGFKARSLIFLTKLTRDPTYWNAWRSFVERHWIGKKIDKSIHPFTQLLQHIPYAASHSWNARWTETGGLRVAPLLTRRFPELTGTVITPRGRISLRARWREGSSDILVESAETGFNSCVWDIEASKEWLLI